MYKIFYFIALYSGFVPFFLYLFKKNKMSSYEVKEVFPFLVLTLVATLFEQVGIVWLRISSSYWFQIYAVSEFLALFYYYGKSQIIQRKHEFVTFFVFFFVVFYGMSWLLFRSENNLLSLFVSQIPIVLLVFVSSFSWFRKLFIKNEIKDLWQSADFYFVSGFLFYCASTFFLFSLSSFLVETSLYFYDYWLVNVLATLFLRIMLSIGVWKMKVI